MTILDAFSAWPNRSARSFRQVLADILNKLATPLRQSAQRLPLDPRLLRDIGVDAAAVDPATAFDAAACDPLANHGLGGADFLIRIPADRRGF